MVKSRIAWLAVLGGCSLAFAAAAPAAHLDLLDQQRIEDASPPAGTMGPPCDTTFNQTINNFIAPDGRSASSTVTQAIDQTGQAADCVQNATGLQASTLTLMLAPDAGESVGGDVVVCLVAVFAQSATSVGNYAAESTIGGGSGVGPATVTRNPSGSAVTVFSFGPETVMENDPPFSQKSTRQFAAQIGDEIEIVLGDKGVASSTGVGNSSIDAFSRIELRVGSCAAPAPATTPVGLAALAVLLAAFGTLRLRLRR